MNLLILFCLVFLDAPRRSILCSVFFLIYIKSNHIVSTVKQLSADDFYLQTFYLNEKFNLHEISKSIQGTN